MQKKIERMDNCVWLDLCGSGTKTFEKKTKQKTKMEMKKKSYWQRFKDVRTSNWYLKEDIKQQMFGDQSAPFVHPVVCQDDQV